MNKKNLRHLRNLRDFKKRPKKNLCISVKSVGLFQAQGYLHRPNRSPLRKSVSNRLRRNTSE